MEINNRNREVEVGWLQPDFDAMGLNEWPSRSLWGEGDDAMASRGRIGISDTHEYDSFPIFSYIKEWHDDTFVFITHNYHDFYIVSYVY